MLSISFIQQLKDVDAKASSSQEAKRKKAELVEKWLQDNSLDFLAELREQAPIFTTPLFTIVTCYTDVMEVFHADEVFTVDAFKEKIECNIGSFILGMNKSPEYERQKSILRLAFPQKDAALIRQIVAEESHRIVVQIATNDFDLVSEYARLLPAVVMRRYLGLEQLPIDKILQWTRSIFRDIFANVINAPEIEKEAGIARSEAVALLDELVVRRHEQIKTLPQTTPINVLDRLLAMQEVASTRLSNEQVRDNLLGLLVGTVDLTSIAILSALVELLSRPDVLLEAQTAARQNNDEMITSYVWEALRFRPPTTGLFRTCTQDYVLGRGTPYETQIQKGTMIYAATAAAMHDQTQVDNPNEFRVGRAQSSYLFFESGLHTCLGKYFSLLQIPLAIKDLLNLGNLEFASPLQKDRGFPQSLQVKILGTRH